LKRILSFGAGVQTTALAILAVQGKVKIDMAIFADTGCERPETYWYMNNYTKPMLASAGIPFLVVKNEQGYYQPDMLGWLWRRKRIPSVVPPRECTQAYKLQPIKKAVGLDINMLIGFSTDEFERSQRPQGTKWTQSTYPLIDMGLTASDCQCIISDYGWPVPLKSSCYICPFQTPFEWQWLKTNHSDLFQKALELEENYHSRQPQNRNSHGLYRGLPLRHIAEGQQYSMGLTLETSCWSGVCGH